MLNLYLLHISHLTLQKMSFNKLALIRYKTIDECLQNRQKKWTLDSLIEKVNTAVYEFEGIENVSKRTIQADLQLMRSDKLGYNAPIIVTGRKYYTYEDAKFSINNAPINPNDVEKLKEAVSILKQFGSFSYFEEMSEVVVKLENSIKKSSKQSKNYIQFEGNKQLRGIEMINPLYQAILHQKPLVIEYQSFTAKNAQTGIYFLYLLKEYRNRWFIIVKRKGQKSIMTFALDRILRFEEAENQLFEAHPSINFDTYYDDTIGVSKTENEKPHTVILQINNENAPYVLTKPLHHSQEILKQDEKCTIIGIKVILNFELEREILGFGEIMKVLAPKLLAKKIKRRIALMYEV